MAALRHESGVEPVHGRRLDVVSRLWVHVGVGVPVGLDAVSLRDVAVRAGLRLVLAAGDVLEHVVPGDDRAQSSAAVPSADAAAGDVAAASRHHATADGDDRAWTDAGVPGDRAEGTSDAADLGLNWSRHDDDNGRAEWRHVGDAVADGNRHGGERSGRGASARSHDGRGRNSGCGNAWAWRYGGNASGRADRAGNIRSGHCSGTDARSCAEDCACSVAEDCATSASELASAFVSARRLRVAWRQHGHSGFRRGHGTLQHRGFAGKRAGELGNTEVRKQE